MIKPHPPVKNKVYTVAIYQHFFLKIKQIPHDLLKQNTVPEIFCKIVQRQNKVQLHSHYTRFADSKLFQAL